jgi:hypothetical protein
VDSSPTWGSETGYSFSTLPHPGPGHWLSYPLLSRAMLGSTLAKVAQLATSFQPVSVLSSQGFWSFVVLFSWDNLFNSRHYLLCTPLS